MDKVVVLTGAGMSADSGLKTFRDSDGLWEGHDIKEVATVSAWNDNKEHVLKFYNERRRKAHLVEPNAGHKAIARLEQKYDVTVITQNVDNLHEKAGSTNVIHLHGELSKVRSEKDKSLVYDIGGDSINIGDTAEDGSQLRPHVVWFGEKVPNIKRASTIVSKADLLLVVGTSLTVYPAAGLIELAPPDIKKYIVDPDSEIAINREWTHLKKRAAVGTPEVVNKLIAK